MSEEKKDLKIKLKDDKGKYYEVISTEQFNIQEELNKEIEINIKYKEVLDKIKEYIEENKYKKMGGYGNNEDEDIEVCLFEDDIWKLEELLEEIE